MGSDGIHRAQDERNEKARKYDILIEAIKAMRTSHQNEAIHHLREDSPIWARESQIKSDVCNDLLEVLNE